MPCCNQEVKMVRGCQKKIIYLKNSGSDLFEEAYFIIKNNHIKCLLFDLDNTCVGYKEKFPTKELEELFINLTNSKELFLNTHPNIGLILAVCFLFLFFELAFEF